MKTSFNELIESELMHRLGWTLIHSLWVLALLGILSIATMILLRKSSAQTRYLSGFLGLILMAIAPLAIFVISPVKEVERPATATMITTTNEMPVEEPSLLLKPYTSPTHSETPLPATTSIPSTIESSPVNDEPSSANWSMAVPWMGLIWLAGIIILSIWRTGGWWTAQRMRSIGSSPIPAHLTTTVEQLRTLLNVSPFVRVLQSSLVEVPVVFGWLKPTILLPVQVLESLSGTQLRMVLAHELAHIRRNDYLANLVQTSIETLLFFHPAVWWVSRRIRIERENCCDDLAVQHCGQRSDLASALVAVEEGRCEPLPNPALAATGGDTHERVSRLLGIPSRRDRIGFSALSILFGVSLFALIGISFAESKATKDQITSPENSSLEDPNDPYNVLYDVLMTRYGPDGKSYAANETSPIILPRSDFPFDDNTYPELNKALDAFAALPQPKFQSYSDVQRAIMQRHLWKVYDATHPEFITESTRDEGIRKQSHSNRRAAVRPKLVSLMQRLALTKDEILALPNTLMAAIESGNSARQPDPKNLTKPFLPTDFYSNESAWICMGDKQEGNAIPAELHAEKFNWRSTFHSYMRAPGGREETIKNIEKYNRREKLPLGTQFALIEQAFLISDEGEQVLSPLIYSIALRAYVGLKPVPGEKALRTVQCLAEFVLQPRELIRGNVALIPLNPKAPRYELGEPECFSGGIDDPFKSTTAYIRPRLTHCNQCHAGWTNRIGFHTARPSFLKADDLKTISKATSARKREDKTWQDLITLWKTNSKKK